MKIPIQNIRPYEQLELEAGRQAEAGLSKLGLSSFFEVEVNDNGSYGPPLFMVNSKVGRKPLFQMSVNTDSELEIFFDTSNYYVRKRISKDVFSPKDLETTWELLSEALTFEAETLKANQIECSPAKALTVRVLFAGIQYHPLTPYLSLKYSPDEIVSLIRKSISLSEVQKYDELPFQWLLQILDFEEREDR